MYVHMCACEYVFDACMYLIPVCYYVCICLSMYVSIHVYVLVCLYTAWPVNVKHMQFIHLFIPAISISPLQVLYHSEAFPTTAWILYWSFTPKHTGNCR